jgi:hypothetical protein
MPASLVNIPSLHPLSLALLLTHRSLTSHPSSPQCKAIAKPLCVEKGHMVECKIHGVSNAAYGVCHKCKAEVLRDENEKTKMNEKEREEEIRRKKEEEKEAKIKAKNDKKMEKFEERKKRKSSDGSEGGGSGSWDSGQTEFIGVVVCLLAAARVHGEVMSVVNITVLLSCFHWLSFVFHGYMVNVWLSCWLSRLRGSP